ncbi:DUF5677 domain-containing protein [Bacillus cytotoxicus]|uniref:DUF5677 domain-containing protein n=1 Tax=Bacillus cereus group sp. BfR-BA-01492 TaxID=2920361 RepID=UPI001F598D88|nr:DUF5677 domain-containing protein [Bacillus cereus group sp. BfR-BA-01492]EMA6344507.1 hypothetical protein [Bacillus cytotoxicus]
MAESQGEILNKSIKFGEDILATLHVRSDFEVEQKVVLSLYRQLIEQCNGYSVLANQKFYDSSKLLVRPFVETYLSLKYILQDKNKIQDRATSYYIGFLKYHENLLLNAKKNNFMNVPEHELREDLFEIQVLLNAEKYKRIQNEWKRTKLKLQLEYEPKWYSLFYGPRSIKELVQRVEEKNEMKLLYTLLSLDAHGYQAVENALYNKNIDITPLYLKPIKHVKNNEFEINMIETYLNRATFEIVMYIVPERLHVFSRFYKDIQNTPNEFIHNILKNINTESQ